MDITKILGNQPTVAMTPRKESLQTTERISENANISPKIDKGMIELSREELKNLADALTSAANALNKRIQFSYNEKINRVVLKVINTENNEVVREIPPRELVRVYEHIHELIGMFVDESR
ncbi:MAG: flagellar protein FlaG [Spirochaetes bacterium]|nr:flagellar protein FlaG [Spirochaetota bacterium]